MPIFMSAIFWWIRQVILTLAGCFFLLFGLHLLVAAYRLNDPSWFIMTFFASNLIILISITLLIGFVYRMILVYRKLKKQ
jgi:hypothetical protein